jgi:hypothetical protein
MERPYCGPSQGSQRNAHHQHKQDHEANRRRRVLGYSRRPACQSAGL